MANNTQFDPQNPDALFSPDQWLNQFSNFNNKALPWPSSYAGIPTDAMGNPIQSAVDANSAAQTQYQQQLAAYNQQKASTPGTTLNSTPSQGFQQGVPNTLNPSGNAVAGQLEWGGLPGTTNHQTAGAYLQGLQANPFSGAQQQPQQPAAPSAPTPPNNWQATLNALANPGKVTTPGATVPATASTQPGSGALQSFLQNWRPAQSGPGSGFQQTFGNLLNQMYGGGGAGGGQGMPQGSGGQPSGNNMLGNQLSGNMIGSTPPPGTPGGAKNAATAGFLDANGVPTQALTALRQQWAPIQQGLAGR